MHQVLSCVNYFRFKNGDIIEEQHATRETMILHDLRIEDTGLYKCRVHSEGGRVYSDEANLTVTGKSVIIFLCVLAGD